MKMRFTPTLIISHYELFVSQRSLSLELTAFETAMIFTSLQQLAEQNGCDPHLTDEQNERWRKVTYFGLCCK